MRCVVDFWTHFWTVQERFPWACTLLIPLVSNLFLLPTSWQHIRTFSFLITALQHWPHLSWTRLSWLHFLGFEFLATTSDKTWWDTLQEYLFFALTLKTVSPLPYCNVVCGNTTYKLGSWLRSCQSSRECGNKVVNFTPNFVGKLRSLSQAK